MSIDTNRIVLDLAEALDRSKTSATGRVHVPRTLLWQAKAAIEALAHRVALNETEAAMQKGQANG
jgi:hypothetical protein